MIALAWGLLTSRTGWVLIAAGAILSLYLLWQDAEGAREAAETRAWAAERAYAAISDQMEDDAAIHEAIDSIREDIADDPSTDLTPDLADFLDRLRDRRPAAGGAAGTD